MLVAGTRTSPVIFLDSSAKGVRKLLAIFHLTLAVMVAESVSAEDPPLPSSLTGYPGNAERGLALMRDSSLPSCVICHRISSLPDRDQGELGPPLDGVANRYDAEQLRQRIIDARVVVPDTIMPPYYSTEGLSRVGEEWAGQTIYSAEDVEDIVAYLLTLRD